MRFLGLVCGNNRGEVGSYLTWIADRSGMRNKNLNRMCYITFPRMWYNKGRFLCISIKRNSNFILLMQKTHF